MPLNADPTRRLLTLAVLATLAADVGCHHRQAVSRYDDEDAPRPVQVVTTPGTVGVNKPLPPQPGTGLYADPAIVRQQSPEEPRYVQAYVGIGRPRVVVFVNRTVTGELVPVNPGAGGRGLTPGDDRSVTYLRPGQYDEAQARGIDYELIENLLSDDLSADGKVTLTSPTAARQRLGEDEVRELQAGRPQMLGELATKLNADVLVQVTAHPSVQTDAGLGVRLVAQALNTHGGQAIAFAAVDVPPPLTRAQLNEYVRFVARKLMDGMSTSWEGMAGPPPAAQAPVQVTPPPPPVMVTPPPPVAVPVAPPPPVPRPTPAPVPVPMVPATPPGRPNSNPLDLPPPP